MQGGMPRPNAAIYYALDAYDTSRPHLMGRHSAGEGFLRGFVRHGGADRLYCYARHAGDAQDFAKRVQAHGATVPITGSRSPIRSGWPSRVACFIRRSGSTNWRGDADDMTSGPTASSESRTRSSAARLWRSSPIG